MSLRYRKFKLSGKPRTLWNEGNSGFPAGSSKDWIKPYFDFFEKYIAGKKIINRLKNQNLWVESRTQGKEQHLLVGDKKSKGEKVHLIFGETGEIRIDKKDIPPSEIFRKVESILTKQDGSIVKSTLEFFNEKVD